MKTLSKKSIRFIVDNVSDVSRWLVYLENIFGKAVADYAEQYHDRMICTLKEEEKYFYTKELPMVREKLKKFKKENDKFAKKCGLKRKREILDEFHKLKQELEKDLETYGNIQEKEKKLEKLENLNRRINSKITNEMIETARQYPIEKLIEVNKSCLAICPFHDDHNPSLCVKNGFAYCFACHYKGDSIKFIMDKDNLDFKEAVKRLSSN